jgi:hypothetical protein
VSSIYDPLGFLSPFTLTGKILLQDVCRAKLDWDDFVGDEIASKWSSWCQQIDCLKNLKVPRCLINFESTMIKSIQLHHFSDASSSGYGQVSYLRIVDCYDQVHIRFLMGKSRVAPLSVVTIPRLELMGAVLSIRIANLLKKELEMQPIVEFFYTDSKVVLGYINNDCKRFHTYVANRIQEIHTFSQPDQWHHIQGTSNPADMASRGVSSKQLIESEWLSGPSFLLNSKFPASDETFTLSKDDPEVKKMAFRVESSEISFELVRFEYFSSWKRLIRAVAWCLRYIRILKQRIKRGPVTRAQTKGDKSGDILSVVDLQEASNLIIKKVQESVFLKEKKY